MSEQDTKGILKSLTTVAITLLVAFNIIDQTLAVQINEHITVIVNAVLGLVAVYGRIRATKKISGILK